MSVARGRERRAFLPKRHVPGRALFSREKLRKAKEQEEVIRARHCYPTLGTLDRNRTWKPTRSLRRALRPPPPPFVPFSPARFCRPVAVSAIDTPHCSCPRTAIILSLLPCDENVEARVHLKPALLPVFVGTKCSFFELFLQSRPREFLIFNNISMPTLLVSRYFIQ